MEEGHDTMVTRRQMLVGTGVVGAGALVVGGVAGGLIGNAVAGDDEEAGAAAAAAVAGGKGTLVVGSPYPLSGPYAADGEQMVNGTKLAIDEINAAGGVGGRKIEHIVVDTEVNSPESVTASLNKLVNDKVDAIVGGYLQVDQPAYDILPAYGAPYLHGNTIQAGVERVAGDPERYSMFFNVDPTEVWYGKGLPKFLTTLTAESDWKPASETMSVIEGDLVYSQIISKATQDAAKESGWRITGVEKVVTPVNEWGPVLGKLRSQSPAIVYNAHPAPADQAAFMKQFVANPTQSLVYLQYGASIPQFLELAGSAADGAIWSTVVGNVGGPLGRGFTERYEERFKKPAGLANAPQGYDTIYMLANAWAMVGDSRNFKGVCDQLRSQRYRGVCGTCYMDQPGQYTAPYPDADDDPSLAMPHLYLQVQNGKHRVIYPQPYADAEFQMPPWLRA
jgi:branched-chain amino acid transport system substrate-binding protein